LSNYFVNDLKSSLLKDDNSRKANKLTPSVSLLAGFVQKKNNPNQSYYDLANSNNMKKFNNFNQ